ncbi:MAG: hypothetical protein ACHQ6T_11250 [Myxococcota bacterium]
MTVPETHAKRPRRAFLEAREIPALVLGTARGDASASRRVLGARRGGRVGVGLALAALALAAPSARAALTAVALHGALSLSLGLANRRRASHTTREVQRLALWTAVTPLCVAALARPLAGANTLPLYAAVLIGQVLLSRALAATR